MHWQRVGEVHRREEFATRRGKKITLEGKWQQKETMPTKTRSTTTEKKNIYEMGKKEKKYGKKKEYSFQEDSKTRFTAERTLPTAKWPEKQDSQQPHEITLTDDPEREGSW